MRVFPNNPFAQVARFRRPNLTKIQRATKISAGHNKGPPVVMHTLDRLKKGDIHNLTFALKPRGIGRQSGFEYRSRSYGGIDCEHYPDVVPSF